jgi:hypothetical protein
MTGSSQTFLWPRFPTASRHFSPTERLDKTNASVLVLPVDILMQNIDSEKQDFGNQAFKQ